MLGTTTTKDLTSTFDKEKNQLRNIGIRIPYWLTWQWKKKSNTK